MIDEKVSQVNDEELSTLYRSCDVALLTPLRDAMNLYAKEFIASRNDSRGVLILSEFDGAASQLTGALFVNPNDIPNVARTIKAALELSKDDRRLRMASMREYVKSHDVGQWGEQFLLALKDAHMASSAHGPSAH